MPNKPSLAVTVAIFFVPITIFYCYFKYSQYTFQQDYKRWTKKHAPPELYKKHYPDD